MRVECEKCHIIYNDENCSTVCFHLGIGYCVACDCTVCTCDENTTNPRSNKYKQTAVIETAPQPTPPSSLEGMLSNIGIELTENQLTCIRALDSGKTVALYDMEGNITGRYKSSQLSFKDEKRGMCITSGDIIEDTRLFISMNMDEMINAALDQSFADNLYVYLRNRMWNDVEIYPVIKKALSIWKQSRTENR